MSLRALSNLRRLRKTQWQRPSRLLKIQYKKIIAIIKHAYENVPFYHRKFDEAGVKPQGIQKIEDLTKIPITTRAEIQDTPMKEIIAQNIDIKNCVELKTSGSTGMPLTLILDKSFSSFDAALWMRTYLENGLKLRDKMAIILDPHSFPRKQNWYQRFGFMKKKYISIFVDVEEQVSALKQCKPDALQSYPSTLALISESIQSNLKEKIHPKIIFSEAEVLNNGTRKLLTSTFKANVFDLYATREFGLMAWECEAHMGSHINVDGLVMEFIDEGENVALGESGKIVCTNLTNYVMPLIRYEVGDVGRRSEELCSCGRALPLMKVLEGRSDDFLITPDGKTISPLVFFPYPFEGVPGIRQFKVIQEKIDKLTIQVTTTREVFPKDPMETWEKASENIRNLFGTNMSVNFEIVEKIPREPSGKFRTVVSRVNRRPQA